MATFRILWPLLVIGWLAPLVVAGQETPPASKAPEPESTESEAPEADDPPSEAAAQEGPEEAFELELDVVGVAPLDLTGIRSDRLPWQVRSLDRAELDREGASLTGALEARIPGVQLSEAQGSPLQPDVSYRGFSASPLLGASQGISLYVDGVRANEIFGDVVAWELVPTFGLEEIELIPGANPIYGLNTLGGAIALRTRDGSRDPGLRLRLESGSWEWWSGQAGFGWAADRRSDKVPSMFVGASVIDDGGWRDFSPSHAAQALAKVTTGSERTRWTATLEAADTSLVGNGAVPIQLLEQDRSAVFTHPDRTENRMLFPRLRLDRRVGTSLGFEAMAYARRNDVDTFNADAFDEAEEVEYEGDDGFDALNNRSRTEQDGWGFSAQLARGGPSGSGRLLVGGSWDEGRAGFSSAGELARLVATRGTVGSGLLLPGSEVGVDVDTRHGALWSVANWSPYRRLALTLQSRYGTSRVRLQDRLGTALDGSHEFDRLLPSAGLTWLLEEGGSSSLLLFANLSQSSRVPTPVELTCADPEDPCRLPNAFVADPPLDQVVTTGGEIGIRGHVRRLAWSALAFGSSSHDDIVFVSSGASTSAGFFTNVDATERQGVEVSAKGRLSEVNWDASYTLVEATFGSELLLPSPDHPRAQAGVIAVRAGDRIPGIPRHQFRAGFSASLTRRLDLGARARYDSSRFARGDEANLLRPVPGAWILDGRLSADLGSKLALDLRVSNLLDRDYETFGAIGDASEVLEPSPGDPLFLSPGAPRTFRLSLRYQVGG